MCGREHGLKRLSLRLRLRQDSPVTLSVERRYRMVLSFPRLARGIGNECPYCCRSGDHLRALSGEAGADDSTAMLSEV